MDKDVLSKLKALVELTHDVAHLMIEQGPEEYSDTIESMNLLEELNEREEGAFEDHLEVLTYMFAAYLAIHFELCRRADMTPCEVYDSQMNDITRGQN